MTENPTLDRLIEAAQAFALATWRVCSHSMKDINAHNIDVRISLAVLRSARGELEGAALGLEVNDGNGK